MAAEVSGASPSREWSSRARSPAVVRSRNTRGRRVSPGKPAAASSGMAGEGAGTASAGGPRAGGAPAGDRGGKGEGGRDGPVEERRRGRHEREQEGRGPVLRAGCPEKLCQSGESVGTGIAG